MSSLTSLLPTLRSLILSYLDVSDLGILQRVSKFYLALCRSNDVFKPLFKQKFHVYENYCIFSSWFDQYHHYVGIHNLTSVSPDNKSFSARRFDNKNKGDGIWFHCYTRLSSIECALHWLDECQSVNISNFFHSEYRTYRLDNIPQYEKDRLELFRSSAEKNFLLFQQRYDITFKNLINIKEYFYLFFVGLAYRDEKFTIEL